MADLHFLHTRVHHVLFRALLECWLAGRSSAARIVFVPCSRCGARWFALVQTALSPNEREQAEYDAARRLSTDCPDHAHRFNLVVPIPRT